MELRSGSATLHVLKYTNSDLCLARYSSSKDASRAKHSGRVSAELETPDANKVALYRLIVDRLNAEASRPLPTIMEGTNFACPRIALPNENYCASVQYRPMSWTSLKHKICSYPRNVARLHLESLTSLIGGMAAYASPINDGFAGVDLSNCAFSAQALSKVEISRVRRSIRMELARDSTFSRNKGSVLELRKLKRHSPKSALIPSVLSTDGDRTA